MFCEEVSRKIHLLSQKKQRMNIALAGYGKMGRMVEVIALERGHKISLIIDVDNVDRLNSGALSGIDVAIEFTVPGAAPEIISRILRAGVPVVSGTTGWSSRYDEIAALAISSDTAFIHSSNYSPGVYMLSKLNAALAFYMESVSGYKASIEEIHHTAKLDAPSGTALMLSELIVKNNRNYSGWVDASTESDKLIPVRSVREGTVPGTHHVSWTSENDILTLSHVALGRRGFALGAVMAAETIATRKGVFKIDDVFGF
jgi:4-hydroxy-tetrahydrodipicolinate reductase